jgi:hypothetical protein
LERKFGNAEIRERSLAGRVVHHRFESDREQRHQDSKITPPGELHRFHEAGEYIHHIRLPKDQARPLS